MLFHYGTLGDGRAPTYRGRRLDPCPELAVYLLTPGFSAAYHSNALGVCASTISKSTRWAARCAAIDPQILLAIEENVASITTEDGLLMARRRGGGQLPFWSRLAIAEYKHTLGSTSAVASLFRCSPRTVQLAVKLRAASYDPLSGVRRLHPAQASPPGKWSPGRVLNSG